MTFIVHYLFIANKGWSMTDLTLDLRQLKMSEKWYGSDYKKQKLQIVSARALQKSELQHTCRVMYRKRFMRKGQGHMVEKTEILSCDVCKERIPGKLVTESGNPGLKAMTQEFQCPRAGGRRCPSSNREQVFPFSVLLFYSDLSRLTPAHPHWQ